MVSFRDIKQLLKPQNETYEGMRTIPVAQIVGSEGRYQDFDNQFFPKSSFLKARWEHVDEAVIKDIILPPIKVYELGGLYFVRDGNHRVSVAKSKGVEFIDAEVVSLKTEVRLRPSGTLQGIVRQIINYEKHNFYIETNFGDITDYWCLDFSMTGQYDIIYDHILTHKYFLNKDKEQEISQEDAVLSWFNTVYLPVIHTIDKYKIMKYFRGKTKSDLYVWVIKSYDELKKLFGDGVPLDTVVSNLKREYKWSFVTRFKNGVKKILFKKNRRLFYKSPDNNK